MRLLLGCGIAAITGWFVVDWLWPRRTYRPDEMLWRACVAIGAGLGLHSCVAFLWLALLPTHVAALFVFDLALMIAGVARPAKRFLSRRRPWFWKILPISDCRFPITRNRPLFKSAIGNRQSAILPKPRPTAHEDMLRWPCHSKRLLIILAGVAILLVAATLVTVEIEQPLGAWDAWMIWNVRARFLYFGGGSPIGPRPLLMVRVRYAC